MTRYILPLLLSVLIFVDSATFAQAFVSQTSRRSALPPPTLAAPSTFGASNILPHSSPSSTTQLSALLDPSVILSQDSIHNAFSVATFLPQPFWVLLTLLPNTSITKTIMGGMQVVTLCALVHFFIVIASIVQPGGSAPLAEFADVFDPAGDPQKAFIGMMQYPNFITEEWSHVLTWDLFVGRWIWLDGLKRGIFTSHSVLLCNLIGPPGLLLHWATCIVSGKGIVGNKALDEEDNA